jgi:hypothetical protein
MQCGECGSQSIITEMRDALAIGPMPPPSTAYGSWNVCQNCGHQWQDTNYDEAEPRDLPTEGPSTW